MNAEILSELNEIKKALGIGTQKSKEQTEKEKIDEWRRRIKLDFLKKGLKG